MRQCMDVPNIQLRIKKIQGQLNAISKIIEDFSKAIDYFTRMG